MKALNSMKKEQGMSLVGALIVVAMVALLGMFAIKVAPVYMENYTVKEILADMRNDRQTATMTVRKIKANFVQRARTNSIYTIKREHLAVKDSGGTKSLRVYYEVKKPLIHNMEVLITFEENVVFDIR